MAYIASLRDLGFASDLRERHPLLSLSDHVFLCQFIDPPVNFVE